MPQASYTTLGPDGQLYIVKAGQTATEAVAGKQLAPAPMQAGAKTPPVNPQKGTDLSGTGPSILKAPPSLGRDPNAKGPSFRNMGIGAAQLAEVGAPFAAAMFPPAAPLLPAIEAMLGGAEGYLKHPEAPGTGALEGAGYQGVLQMLPLQIGRVLSRAGNRVGMAMKGVSNDLPGGGKLVDALDRMRQDTRRMFPQQDPYGQKQADIATAALNGPKPGALPPGSALPNTPRKLPSLPTVLKQGTGIRFGRNVIPLGAQERLGAAKDAAGKALADVETSSNARVPMSRVLDPQAPELQALRQKVNDTFAHPVEGQDAITQTRQKFALEQGGKAHLRAEGEPLEAGHDAINQFRADEDSLRDSTGRPPISDEEFIQKLMDGKQMTSRDVGQLTRAARQEAGTAFSNPVKGVAMKPGQNAPGQTYNAYSQRARDINRQINPQTGPANARESDLFTALGASKPAKGVSIPSVNLKAGVPTYANPGLIKEITAYLAPRIGNMSASAAEAAPQVLRVLSSIFRGGPTPF